MQIIIVGAGVIGVTLAYELAKQGHSIQVIESHKNVALDASFANAGQISPGYASPWAAPGVPLKALGWLLQQHAPLSIDITLDVWQWSWMFKMLKQCNAQAYKINKERMLRIAEYSRDCLKTVRADLNLNYDARMLGTTQIFRTQAQLDIIKQKDIPVLERLGIEHQLLSVHQLKDYEPALANHKELVGGLRLPNDETGDCYKFTQQLANYAQALGVEFMFNTKVKRLHIPNQNDLIVKGIVLENEQILKADAVVVAMGAYSRDFLKPYGLNLPVYPVKGYSMTAPIINETQAPQSTLLDETYKIALTRLGNRLRVGGMAHISDYNPYVQAKYQHTLNTVADDLFAKGIGQKREFWCGLRPMTPDSTPIIGATTLHGLWLSTGHGTLGWTMAMGSAVLLSQLISKQTPSIKYDDLGLGRYG